MRRLLLAFSLSIAPLLLAQSEAPDLIIFNARVFTGDPTNPKAQAVAISGDHISAVGTNDQVKSIAGRSTKRIDAQGHVVIPGLNDALMQQCTAPAFSTSANEDAKAGQLLAAIAGAADETPADLWIGGRIGAAALNDDSLTTASIDKASQGHRVILVSSDGNAVVANNAAFSALRTNDSHDPAGGWWTRDASGRSNGKGFEYAARNLMRQWADTTPDADAIDQLRDWGAGVVQLGVTSVQMSPCLPFQRLERFARRASLPLRVRIINTPLTNNDSRNVDELREMPKPDGPRAMIDVTGIKWSLGGAKPNFPNSEIASMLKEGSDANQELFFDVTDAKTAAPLLDALKAAGQHRVELEGAITPDMLPALHDLCVVVVLHVVSSNGAILKSIVMGGGP